MTVINTLVPFLSSAISFIFALVVLARYIQKKSPHLLLWGIGMVFYGIGGFCEGYYGAFGWNPLIFRLWYLSGAVFAAAWLGQGTVYLLMKRKAANIFMVILILGSIYGAFKVFTAGLDPSMLTTGGHTGSELSGDAIITPGVRILTPFFNTLGTLFLVGGAAWSAWIFYRKRILLHRVIGNVLIASGALLPAFGGLFSRMGIPAVLYLGEFFGAILMFAGFLRATTPMQDPVTEAAASD